MYQQSCNFKYKIDRVDMAVYRVTKKPVEKLYEISCREFKLFSHKIMF